MATIILRYRHPLHLILPGQTTLRAAGHYIHTARRKTPAIAGIGCLDAMDKEE